MPRRGLSKKGAAKRARGPLVEKLGPYLTEDVKVPFGRHMYIILPVTALAEMYDATISLGSESAGWEDLSVFFDYKGMLRTSGGEYVTTGNTGKRIQRKRDKKTGLVELYQVPPVPPKTKSGAR